MPDNVRPEDCPTPEYHDTHHYCPSCSFTSGVAPLSEAGKLRKRIDEACDAVSAVHPAKSASFQEGVDHAVSFIRAALAE